MSIQMVGHPIFLFYSYPPVHFFQKVHFQSAFVMVTTSFETVF